MRCWAQPEHGIARLNTAAGTGKIQQATVAGKRSAIDSNPDRDSSDYHRGQSPVFHDQACKRSSSGIVSKRADAAYAPGNRSLWLKVKYLYRKEFVVVGWTA
jgi:ATP-dependent DNA ligase